MYLFKYLFSILAEGGVVSLPQSEIAGSYDNSVLNFLGTAKLFHIAESFYILAVIY